MTVYDKYYSTEELCEIAYESDNEALRAHALEVHTKLIDELDELEESGVVNGYVWNAYCNSREHKYEHLTFGRMGWRVTDKLLRNIHENFKTFACKSCDVEEMYKIINSGLFEFDGMSTVNEKAYGTEIVVPVVVFKAK